MSSKRRKSGENEAMIRAAYDMLSDTMRVWKCECQVRLVCSNRPGVFRVNSAAMVREPDGVIRTIARYECEYPSAEVLSLDAAVFRAAVSLDRLVSETLGTAGNMPN